MKPLPPAASASIERAGLSLPELAQSVARLAAAYTPASIYLFGSCARGEATPDSDVDLAIVVRDDAPPEQRSAAAAYRAFGGIEASIEIVIWPESDFTRKQRVVTSMPATIVREGLELYAA